MTLRKKEDNSHLFLLGMTLLFSFLSVLWTISPQNGLVYDDVTLLAEARFSNYADAFSIFPAMSYNDRPVRMLFLKVLNEMFGLSTVPYHLVFVGFHLWNVYLVYRVCEMMLCCIGMEKDRFVYSVIPAAIFGVFPTSLMAVQWISSTCDFQCCNFMLLSAYFYFKLKLNPQYTVQYTIFSLSFYVLSLRCKEMSLAFPVILLVYELAQYLRKRVWQLPWKTLAILNGFMLVYTAMLFAGGQSEVPQDNPYYQSFSPLLMLRNAFRYLCLYFDWNHGGFTYTQFQSSATWGLILFALIFVFSLWLLIFKKRAYLFLSLIAAGGSIVVVLPMVNMQHRLYLYIPSIFLGLTAAVVCMECKRCFSRFSVRLAVLALIPMLYFFNMMPGMVQFRASWLQTCAADQKEWKQLEAMESPVKMTTVYVKGAQEGYNIFFYGPGNALRLLYDDETLITVLVDEFPKEPQAPYLFLEYDDGQIREVKRNRSVDDFLKINLIYPEELVLTDEQLSGEEPVFVGLETAREWEDLQILLNGKSIQYTKGDGFYSFTVPTDLLEVGKDLKVALYSEEAGGKGKEVKILMKG